MSKASKIAAIAVVAVGIVSTTVFTSIKADEVYDDSSVGISSALDRYVESVTQEEELLNETIAASTEESTALSEDGATKEADVSDTTETAGTAESAETAESSETTGDTEATTEATTEGTTEETCKYPQFEDRCLTTATDYVNIRTEADENSDLVGTLAAGGIALVKEKGDEWTYIASGSCEGYIKNDYLVFGDEAGEYAEEHLTKLATITTETLKVREEADEDSACITMVPGGEEYAIISEEDGWTQIEVDDGTVGYVSNEYITTSFQVVRAVSVEEAEAKKAAEEAAAAAAAAQAAAESSSSSSSSSSSGSSGSSSVSTSTVSNGTGTEVANYALQFVGNPYVWGGTSLTNGADCSGFVLSVYAHFGYSLPHSSASQSNCGTEVSLSELQPGDLLFYSNGGSIGHVAIYIGNGQVVHASSAKTGIKVSAYNYRTPAKAVRIIN